MAQVTFKNLTQTQAVTLAQWYADTGEQNAQAWFDKQHIEAPFTDVDHRGRGIIVRNNGDVEVYIRIGNNHEQHQATLH